MAKTDPRLNVTRATRTETELGIQRNLRAIRRDTGNFDGLLYSGTRKNVVTVEGMEISETRYVLEFNEATVLEIGAWLAKKSGVAWNPAAYEKAEATVTEIMTGKVRNLTTKAPAQSPSVAPKPAQGKAKAAAHVADRVPTKAARKAPAKATVKKKAGTK